MMKKDISTSLSTFWCRICGKIETSVRVPYRKDIHYGLGIFGKDEEKFICSTIDNKLRSRENVLLGTHLPLFNENNERQLGLFYIASWSLNKKGEPKVVNNHNRVERFKGRIDGKNNGDTNSSSESDSLFELNDDTSIFSSDEKLDSSSSNEKYSSDSSTNDSSDDVSVDDVSNISTEYVVMIDQNRTINCFFSSTCKAKYANQCLDSGSFVANAKVTCADDEPRWWNVIQKVKLNSNKIKKGGKSTLDLYRDVPFLVINSHVLSGKECFWDYGSTYWKNRKDKINTIDEKTSDILWRDNDSVLITFHKKRFSINYKDTEKVYLNCYFIPTRDTVLTMKKTLFFKYRSYLGEKFSELEQIRLFLGSKELIEDSDTIDDIKIRYGKFIDIRL